MLLLWLAAAQNQPSDTVVYVFGAVLIFGLLVAGAIKIVKITITGSESKHRSDIIRAIGELIRGLGGPPGGVH